MQLFVGVTVVTLGTAGLRTGVIVIEVVGFNGGSVVTLDGGTGGPDGGWTSHQMMWIKYGCGGSFDVSVFWRG